MQGSWSQILVGGVLGAGLWSVLVGVGSPATAPPVVAQVETTDSSPTSTAAEVPAKTAAPEPAEPIKTPDPSPIPTTAPTPQANSQPPIAFPILRGTLVGRSCCAILEYQGAEKVVREGEAIGPFVIGGIYPKQASVAMKGQKFFLPLVPQSTASPAALPTSKGEGSTEHWVRNLSVTQVERDGTPVGLLIHRNGATNAPGPQDGPLSPFGIYDNDVVKAVNGRPLRSQADLWWLHQELLHSPCLEIALERGGLEQTLRQNR